MAELKKQAQQVQLWGSEHPHQDGGAPRVGPSLLLSLQQSLAQRGLMLTPHLGRKRTPRLTTPLGCIWLQGEVSLGADTKIVAE